MMEQTITPPTEYLYDRVPYPNVSHSLSHPDRLATVAMLLGMTPAPIEQCRVLEVGCAGGGNLVPMAYALPESHFTGLDLSQTQIDEGHSIIADLGLTNITLKQMDVLDVTADFGQFDYIIAHGVYSWVPLRVREKLFQICRQNLAPEGVAYISYNTYPGWNMLGTLREMMLYHTRKIDNSLDQAAEARKFLDFLTDSIPTDSSSHGGFLYVYANYIKDYFLPKSDSLLLHDELAEINTPVYFHQFAAQALDHGLQYIGDVNFSSMLATNFPPEVSEALRKMATNTIELEQYLDFLRNRMFRQSLLCHREVTLRAKLTPERLRHFYVASSAMPESTEPEVSKVAVEKFHTLDGATFSTDHPLTKAAMLHLIDVWPRVIAFDELLEVAQARLGRRGVEDDQQAQIEAQIVGANLLKAYSYSENLLEFHVYAPRFTTEISEKPEASPVVRYQAARGYQITNLRHERMRMDKISETLLSCLDGRRGRAALIQHLKAADLVEIEHQEGQPLTDSAVEEVLAEMVDKKLEQFADAALLVA